MSVNVQKTKATASSEYLKENLEAITVSLSPTVTKPGLVRAKGQEK